MSIVAFLCRISLELRSTHSFRKYFSGARFFCLNLSSQGKDNLLMNSITCVQSNGSFLLSVTVRSKLICAKQNYRLIATHSNCDEQDSMSEMLKQVLLAAGDNLVSTRETCGTLLENLCRSKNLSHATLLVKRLHDRQIYLSRNVYQVALAAAADMNDFELSSLVFKDLLLTTVVLDPEIYIYVAKACAKVTDLLPLLRLIREVSELTFPRGVTVVNRIIFSFYVSGQAEKALLIYEEMKNLKCKPDIVTFNTVLGMLGKEGQVDRMICEYASMKACDCDPDLVTYYTLINSSRRMGRFNLLFIFIQEMIKRGIQPDLRTYTALMDGFGRAGHAEYAYKLHMEMKTKRLFPNIHFCRALISNLKKAGKFQLALRLSEDMNMNSSQV